MVLAIYIYRRTCVCRSKTVTLPTAELADLGISRPRKHEALSKLEAAELIRVERVAGQTAKVTLLWEFGRRQVEDGKAYFGAMEWP